jgi:hypothetical protein
MAAPYRAPLVGSPVTVLAVPGQPVRVVGSVLVRNEDRHVAQALRNVLPSLDHVHAFDHMSTDGTWEILREVARQADHVEVARTRDSGDAHRALAPYVGTSTWILGVDGDELYDPEGIARLREALLAGEHTDVFRLKAHVLNCDELNQAGATASGWLAPPSRPVTKLFNFQAVESWPESPDPLQSGPVVFRDGFEWESKRDLAESTTWETDPLRLLHLCFVPRSTVERDEDWRMRQNLDESRAFRRDAVGSAKRLLRRAVSRSSATGPRPRNWKQEWYARGERVTVDASPFLGGAR